MIDINEKVSYKEFFDKQKEVISWLEDDLSKKIFAVKAGINAGLSNQTISLYAKGCVRLKCKDNKVIEDILDDCGKLGGGGGRELPIHRYFIRL